jgi:hypothetical protein
MQWNVNEACKIPFLKVQHFKIMKIQKPANDPFPAILKQSSSNSQKIQTLRKQDKQHEK